MKIVNNTMFPLWKRYGLQENSPIKCDFKVGDRVIYCNDYGVEFDCDIVGFAKDDSFYGQFIHFVEHNTDGRNDAWWFPESPSHFRKHE